MFNNEAVEISKCIILFGMSLGVATSAFMLSTLTVLTVGNVTEAYYLDWKRKRSAITDLQITRIRNRIQEIEDLTEVD